MLRTDLDRLLDETLQDRRLLSHPFYRRWEAGELERFELAAYAGQYRHFEAALPEVLGRVVDTLPEGPARALVSANLDDERSVPAPHLSLFDEFGAAVGAPATATAEPATEALVACYRRGADNGAVTALAMIAAYEVQAPAVASSKAEGLRLRYGLDSSQTRFWDVHGQMDLDHGDWTLDALAALAQDEESVREAARAAADAWWAFLDERQEAARLAAAC